MSKKFLILLLGSVLLYLPVCAQELEYNVTIDARQTPDLPKNITDDIKNAILTFVNRRWTNDQFSPQERIKVNLVITLSKGSVLTQYTSIAQIQFVRPVYGATFETEIITFIDQNFDFQYTQGQPLDYNENVYLSYLASLLSFYSYVALALDYDSFSKMGGSPYIEKAYALAYVAYSASPAPIGSNTVNGWETNVFNNRMALITNLNNQQFAPFREGLYLYHRQGLDKFIENPDLARKNILEVLKKIKITRQAVSVSILNGSFFLAKKQELIQIFSKASPEMKTEVVNLLKDVDAVNTDAYSAILKN
ncbi:MAG TPA: DUF4835 family protein [Cytophagaceae bacterium]|jgi:hypothetical protein|nr:DUF4835 family protein [Cytophagaceae bacterium]